MGGKKGFFLVRLACGSPLSGLVEVGLPTLEVDNQNSLGHFQIVEGFLGELMAPIQLIDPVKEPYSLF